MSVLDGKNWKDHLKSDHFSRLQLKNFKLGPANISTSGQRCFNVLDQRLNNVDPTLKMKQNSM